jgi:CheY-like chemotaxis protein
MARSPLATRSRHFPPLLCRYSACLITQPPRSAVLKNHIKNSTATTTQVVRRRTLTIALVTDDSDLRQACARVLRHQDHIVFEGSHAGHAMLACLKDQPIDLLISELSMADVSGPALARRMLRHSPGLRAIYLAKVGTTFESENVLVRPFTRDDLLRRLAPIC